MFDDDFMPFVQTSAIFFYFTLEYGGRPQASNDFFRANTQLTLFFSSVGNARRDW